MELDQGMQRAKVLARLARKAQEAEEFTEALEALGTQVVLLEVRGRRIDDGEVINHMASLRIAVDGRRIRVTGYGGTRYEARMAALSDASQKLLDM